MQDTLSNSQLFAEASSLEIPDTLKWSGDMMFPDNYQVKILMKPRPVHANNSSGSAAAGAVWVWYTASPFA